MELRNIEISMIKIETEAELVFKITIHQMKYSGVNNSSCDYAGMALHDITGNGTFGIVSSVCYSDKQEYKYRNLHTDFCDAFSTVCIQEICEY